MVLEELWTLSDDLFDHKITAKNALVVPISLRLPFIFYAGHLPAFAALKLLSASTRESIAEACWHAMFSRGIDPDVDDPKKCHAHPRLPEQWPSWREVMSYREAVQKAIRTESGGVMSPRRLLMVAEHEAMHIETLHYMLAQQRRSKSHCCNGDMPLNGTEIRLSSAYAAVTQDLLASLTSVGWCNVPEGKVTIGRKKPNATDTSVENDFAWDNEYDCSVKTVGAFQVRQYAVTIGEMMAFILSGGYTEQYWSSEDWTRARRQNLRHPASWECQGHGVEGLLGAKVLTANGANWSDVRQLPVSTSLAEARAFARWRTVRLPMEAEWVRAAWGRDGHTTQSASASPTPRDVRADGPHDVRVVTPANPVAWCGAVGLIGNGWEWTDSVFDTFDGFQPAEEYPEYSADFFDGKHFVLRGASWVTHPRLVRPSFRNFYQVGYPCVFSKIRVVRDGAS